MKRQNCLIYLVAFSRELVKLGRELVVALMELGNLRIGGTAETEGTGGNWGGLDNLVI